MVETKRAHRILTAQLQSLLDGMERLPDCPEVRQIRENLEKMLEITNRELGQVPKNEPDESDGRM